MDTPTTMRTTLEAKVEREQEFTLELWTQRYTFAQIRQIANRHPDEGGLGYDLAITAIKGLILGARQARGDVTLSRDDRIERQVAEVDERARAARRDFGAAYSRMAVLDEAIENFVGYEPDDMRVLASLMAERRMLAADLDRADQRFDRAQAREAKLLGLDAPAAATLEVTTRDGTLDDLNAALARLGEAPVKVPADDA